MAEQTGLIRDLTPILFGKALAALRTWPEDVRLSFNLSAQDIASPASVARLAELSSRAASTRAASSSR